MLVLQFIMIKDRLRFSWLLLGSISYWNTDLDVHTLKKGEVYLAHSFSGFSSILSGSKAGKAWWKGKAHESCLSHDNQEAERKGRSLGTNTPFQIKPSVTPLINWAPIAINIFSYWTHQWTNSLMRIKPLQSKYTRIGDIF